MFNLPPIILASKSERRTKILDSLNIPHKIVISNACEHKSDKGCPATLVQKNAKLKANSVAEKYRDSVVIGADTVVVCEDRIFGKPKNIDEAEEYFNFFMGKQIEVFTGLVLCYKTKEVSGFDESIINVRNIDRKNIKKILASFDHCSRAGGFALETVDAVMFDNIQGSYFNILGLPVHLLFELLAELDVDFIKELL